MDGRDLTLTGEVAAVVFRNDGTGFGVVEMSGEGPVAGARAAGPLSGLVEGQPVKLTGRWSSHERYGPTFTTVAYEIVAPRTTDGLATFLSSDRFPGVGKAIAERMVDAFGLDLADVIVGSPDRLTSVKGVSRALADRIAMSWREAGALPELVAALAAAGIPAAAVTDLHRRHGADAAAVIERDPYAVLEIPGVRWTQAERLARQANVERTDLRRLVAAPQVSLADERDQGHTLSDTDMLRRAVKRLTGVDEIDVRRGMDAAAAGGRVVQSDIAGRSWWALPAEARAEQALARELTRLVTGVRTTHEVLLADDELTERQQQAVRAALSAGVSVLTGGPGTGKTRTIRAVVEACDAAGLRIALCAPTGRAAKRLEELTGHPATTVHRLLEAQPAMFGQSDDATFTFSYARDRRLPHDLVVMDECSMADTDLARALTEAVPDGGRLLLVGDTDQLPSVGPGAVLRDVLTIAPTVIPRVHLDVVHRQAAKSRIVTMAHELRRGFLESPRGRDGDVFAVPQPPPGLANRIAEIVAVRAPEFFDITPSDVQVLSPMYRGAGGVDRLNERLSERLNPAKGRPALAGFREGDRVVQTRNDAELDVANGEVGEVASTDVRAGTLDVAFPAGVVTFSKSQARNLRSAWCLTVHKSQGGEWPVVVLALDPAHRSMLYRELVYTAITRAQVGLLLVGDAGLVAAAAAHSGSGLLDRRTGLVGRFESEFQSDGNADVGVRTPAGRRNTSAAVPTGDDGGAS